MFRRVVVVFALMVVSWRLSAYSVLTHEEIVDLAWEGDIRPLLLARFPGSTPDELREAHAYAYGGAVIQDLGYYPFGGHYFSDLTHYVRSGDLTLALIRDASDINEYAFALGALSHYASDTMGHPAVNRSVAIEYPKLAARFGPRVTYAEAKVAHLETEFGFDVVQVAKQRYAPQAYHDFIGFKVAKPLLDRAFQDTYGFPLKDTLIQEDLALGTYRRSVSKVIPKMTKVALATRETQMAREYPDFQRSKFLYTLSKADYEKEWGRDYDRPGPGARVLAFMLHLIPKFGPFRGVKYKDPTPQTEDLYFKSINGTMDYYRQLLHELKSGELSLENRNFDTGRPTHPGEYSLTDETYATLLDRLNEHDPAIVPAGLRSDILRFYSDTTAPNAVKRSRKKWARTMSEIDRLKTASEHADIATAPGSQH